MYVQCERCKTEYEFDDALVSERGTTVKCTSCAHQFRIRKVGTGGDDRWIVKTANGEERIFASLKELQRTILSGGLSREDVLRRAGLADRTLGSIAELESFFRPSQRQSITGVAPPATGGVTLRPTEGVPAPAIPRHAPLPRNVSAPPDVTQSMAAAPIPEGTPDIGTAKTMSASVAALAPPSSSTAPQAVAPPSAGPQAVAPPSTVAQAVAPPSTGPQAFTPTSSAPRPLPAVPSSYDPAHDRESWRRRQAYVPENRFARRSDPAPDSELPASSVGVPKRGGVRWLFPVVVLAALGGAVYYFGRPYLARVAYVAPSPSAGGQSAANDARLVELIVRGEAALADGSLEVADENFTKATVLGEREPRVVHGIARAAVVRGDHSWLELRLGAALARPDADLTILKRRLDEEAKRAARLAEGLRGVVGGDDPRYVSVAVDALRLSGDLDGARKLLVGRAQDPNLAYALGMLDLAEATPSTWGPLLDRLRASVSAEPRARAALVYALVRAGEVAKASDELERLALEPRAHPLLPLLRAFVSGKKAGPVDAGAPDASAKPAGVSPGGALPQASSNDPRTILSLADRARNRGDFGTARSLYEQVLRLHPNDSEALGGLGDVAHEQHDTANARSYYMRALSQNSGFLPAKLGLADLLWETGEKAAAVKAYKEIVDTHPARVYPPYVRTRADSGP